jgi:hypothetical protein
MPQQDFDELKGRVPGTAQNRYSNHGKYSFSKHDGRQAFSPWIFVFPQALMFMARFFPQFCFDSS